MRVYELAKEYEYKATAFLDIIQSFGIGVNSHMSGLDEDQVKDIRFKMEMLDHTKEGKADNEGPQVDNESDTEKWGGIYKRMSDDPVMIKKGDKPNTDYDESLEGRPSINEDEEIKVENVEGEVTESTDWEMSPTDGDSVAEPVNMEEIKNEIDKGVENAAKAREEYSKTVRNSQFIEDMQVINDGSKKTKEREEHLKRLRENPESQQVTVETTKGFFGWLKNLFS